MPSEVRPNSSLMGATLEAPISHKAGDGELKKMHEAAGDGHADYEQIARLAHRLWEERGSPDGSPEDDWLKAEQSLAERESR